VTRHGVFVLTVLRRDTGELVFEPEGKENGNG
jgi:hypothetical protein